MPLGTPDILLLLSEELAVVDNLAGKLYLVVYADPRNPRAYAHGAGAPAQAAARGCARRSRAARARRRAVAQPAAVELRRGGLPARRWRRAKRYISDGDIMQVQISQRLTQRFAASPLDAVPRAAHAQPVALHVLLRLRRLPRRRRLARDPGAAAKADTVTLRPIAGTRRAARRRRRIARSPSELLADPKERAEHLMLIDLGRNDVGRVARDRHGAGDRARW